MANLSEKLRTEAGRLAPEACCASWELHAIELLLGDGQGSLSPCGDAVVERIRMLAEQLGLGCETRRLRRRLLREATRPPRDDTGTDRHVVRIVADGSERRRRGHLKRCCRGAVLRGAFVRGGYLGTEGHFEVSPRSKELVTLLLRTRIPFRQTCRNSRSVLYLKDKEVIAEVVGTMGAFETMLALEDLLVTRRMRNDINRVVNCELGNLSRVSRSAVSMLEDIRKLDEEWGLESLPARLLEVAQLRTRHPTDSLRELARKTRPAISKSGMQHRLEEIARLAAELRRQHP